MNQDGQPLISVLMPAYNAAKYIRESIRSVQAQSYASWELIIINDGSSDDTARIVGEFSGDTRIRFWEQANKGVSSARNLALANMSGAFFTFLDADDLLPVHSLQVRVAYAIGHPKADIVSGGVSFFRGDPEQPDKVWRPAFEGDPLRLLVRIDERVFSSVSYFVRRDACLSYSFREGMTHVEDLLFITSVAAQRPMSFHSIPEVVYAYRLGHTSAMANLDGLEEGYWQLHRAVKKMPHVKKADLRYQRRRLTRIMVLSYLAAGRPLSAMRAFFHYLIW